MNIDVGIARPHGGCTLEGAVEGPDFLPVGRVLADSIKGYAWMTQTN